MRIDDVRIESMLAAAVVVVVVAVAVSGCVPPPQGPPPAQPVAAAASYGTCEQACGHIARCQLSPYQTCVDGCRMAGNEQAPGGREQLDGMSRTPCDQLAAAMRAQAQAQAPVAATTPQTGAMPPAYPPANDPTYAAGATSPAATATATATVPATPASAGASAATTTAGRWVSDPWASYTNAAMTSSSFYLEIATVNDGGFSGSWARYVCLTQTYGIWSCGKDQSEGAATGRLEANGTGWIQLERLGRSTLVWTAKSANELAIELPRNWQSAGVLFKSTVKRR
jgi:hypothetical protein